MTTFTRTWNSSYEATPPSTQVIRQGYTRIQEIKKDVRERLEVDHYYGGEGSSNNNSGYHKWAHLSHQPTDPTHITDYGILFARNVGAYCELFYRSASGTVQQVTTAGVLTPPTSFTYLGCNEQGSNPTPVANRGFFYTKDVGGVTEAYYMNQAGTVVRITNGSTLVAPVATTYLLAGRFNSSGGTIQANGLSASRTGVGQFTVTHNLGKLTYSITATVESGPIFPLRSRTMEYITIGSNTVTFYIKEITPAGLSEGTDLVDTGFNITITHW